MRLRLFLSFALVVMITLLSVLMITANRTGSELRKFIERGGLTGNSEIAESLEAHYSNLGSWEGVEPILRMGEHGQGPGPGGGRPPSEDLVLAGADGRYLYDRSGAQKNKPPFNDEDLQASIPLYVDGELIGYLIPEIRYSILPAVEIGLLRRLNQSAITAGIIAGIFSLGFALVLAYVLLRPIRELTNAVEALGRGDLNQRVPVRGEDEIAGLAKTFNLMAASLSDAEERRKALTADIAHELRNPLAVQRANLEAVQDGVIPLNQETLRPVIEQTRLLESLVDDLRILALADADELGLNPVPTDIVALLKRTGQRFEAHASEKSIQLRISLPANCAPIELDPVRIDQILGNLIDNAIRFTPENGVIELNMTCSGEQVRIAVHDSGDGFPAEEIPYLFDRFYRGDRARERSEGNTGLGLAIAKRLTEAHGGTVFARNHENGGAIFELVFPFRNAQVSPPSEKGSTPTQMHNS